MAGSTSDFRTTGCRNRVLELRLRALIPKQSELARRANIPRSTLSAIENNRLLPNVPQALRLAEVLSCSLDDLFDQPKSRTHRVDGAR